MYKWPCMKIEYCYSLDSIENICVHYIYLIIITIIISLWFGMVVSIWPFYNKLDLFTLTYIQTNHIQYPNLSFRYNPQSFLIFFCLFCLHLLVYIISRLYRLIPLTFWSNKSCYYYYYCLKRRGNQFLPYYCTLPCKMG